MTALSERQFAEIRALLGDARPATGELLTAFAEQIRDRREHDHGSAGPDWDWFCLNVSGWLGDKAPTVLRRLLDAEAEIEQPRAELATARADRDAEIIAWLVKKAGEYGSTRGRQESTGDVLCRMADKISRGAVRPAAGAGSVVADPMSSDLTVWRAWYGDPGHPGETLDHYRVLADATDRVHRALADEKNERAPEELQTTPADIAARAIWHPTGSPAGSRECWLINADGGSHATRFLVSPVTVLGRGGAR